MSLSKRERLLAYGVGGVLGLLALDYLVLTPFINQRNALEEMQAQDARETMDAKSMHREERALKLQWAQRRSQGLASDSREAERQLLKAIKDWAAESDLTLASVKPEYIESKKELREMQVQAAGTGNHVAIVKFLYKLQTAQFPVRVTEVQVGSKTDSAPTWRCKSAFRRCTWWTRPSPRAKTTPRRTTKKRFRQSATRRPREEDRACEKSPRHRLRRAAHLRGPRSLGRIRCVRAGTGQPRQVRTRPKPDGDGPKPLSFSDYNVLITRNIFSHEQPRTRSDRDRERERRRRERENENGESAEDLHGSAATKGLTLPQS